MISVLACSHAVVKRLSSNEVVKIECNYTQVCTHTQNKFPPLRPHDCEQVNNQAVNMIVIISVSQCTTSSSLSQ